MFDKYLIDQESVRNTGPDAAPTGFSFDAKLGYYRGIGLSMIDDLAVTLNGESIDRNNISLKIAQADNAFKLTELGKQLELRWEFGEPATIFVKHIGGLPSGEHQIGFKEVLRVSYLPFPGVSEDLKTVTVE